MARPIRVDVAGGWYHVTARGTERRTIFADNRDHAHFLDLLAEMTTRYGVEVQAYALLGNHYHLLIRAPQANTSAAIQWLNVSYSVWFNRKRNRVGHVFQGRFGSVLIDGEGSWALNASAYIHLNPVRVAQPGLGKAANRAEGAGLVQPSRAELQQRLKTLRAFRWSSFRCYAGYSKGPEWLQTAELLKRAGGQRQYRRLVQAHVTRGIPPEGFEDLAGRVALGSREFQGRLKAWVRRVTGEQPGRWQVQRTVSLETIIATVEQERGARWEEFAERHGDWGRDLALYLARKRSGLTLEQIGAGMGGLPYKAVGKAVQRFAACVATDREKRVAVESCMKQLSKVET